MRAHSIRAVATAIVCLAAHPCAGQSIVDWVVHGTDPENPGLAIPYDISVSSSGDVTAIGVARDGAAFPFDSLDSDPYRIGYIAQSSSSGSWNWSHRGLTVTQYDGMMGYLAAVASGHTYTAEGLYRSFDAGAREFGGQDIIAYDEAGEMEWVVAVADSTDSIAEINAYVKGLELDGSGQLYYSALFFDTLSVHDQQYVADGVDALVASLNPDGSYRWVSAVTGPGNQAPAGFVYDWAGGLDVSPSGRVVVAGLFPVGSVFGAGEETETTLDESGAAIGYFDGEGNFLRVDLDCLDLEVCGFAIASRVAIAPDHSIRTVWRFGWSGGLLEVDVGDTTFTDPGYEGAFVTSHDSTGALQWATQFRGDGNENLMSIAVDGAGKTYVGGAFDALEMTIGPNTTLRKSDLQIDELDGFVVRLDSLGRVTWSMQVYGPDSQFINAIDVDDAGNVYFAGHFAGTAYIGDDVYQSSGTDWLHGKVSISTINSTEKHAVPLGRLAVYPNPARYQVNIEYPAVCRGARNVDAAVFDVLGRRVGNDANAGPLAAGFRLNIRSLPSGLYVAAVTCDGERATASFVVN